MIFVIQCHNDGNRFRVWCCLWVADIIRRNHGTRKLPLLFITEVLTMKNYIFFFFFPFRSFRMYICEHSFFSFPSVRLFLLIFHSFRFFLGYFFGFAFLSFFLFTYFFSVPNFSHFSLNLFFAIIYLFHFDYFISLYFFPFYIVKMSFMSLTILPQKFLISHRLMILPSFSSILKHVYFFILSDCLLMISCFSSQVFCANLWNILVEFSLFLFIPIAYVIDFPYIIVYLYYVMVYFLSRRTISTLISDVLLGVI